MDFINIVSDIGAPVLNDWIGGILKWLYESLSGANSLGWAVVLFTLLVRAVLLPLDIWQKIAMKKQQRATQLLQPQMERLQEQFANRPDILRQEQAKLQKKSGISMLGTCLPLIANLIIFGVIFAGFRAFVSYQNAMDLHNMALRYAEVVGNGGEWTLATSGFSLESFYWIQNVYMPDHWSAIIPTYDTYMGTGLGGIGATMPMNALVINGGYDEIMGPVIQHYNVANSRWNGFMILPILSIATSFLSSRLMQAQNKKNKASTNEKQTKQKNQARTMMLIMPLISGVFSLLYSATFAIYMLTSNIFTSTVGLLFNLISGLTDKKLADKSV